MFVVIVNDTSLRSYLWLCALEHRPSAPGIAIRFEPKVETTNTLNAVEDQHRQLSLVESQAAEESFRQPTEAELSIPTFLELRYAQIHEQELSNEFARLLNRGSSLE